MTYLSKSMSLISVVLVDITAIVAATVDIAATTSISAIFFYKISNNITFK